METPGTDEVSTERNTPLSETQDNSQGNEDTGDVNSSTGPSVACSTDTLSTDVLCDSCIESPSRALKSCLTCLVSYCGAHLRPHLEKTKFQNHRLVEPLPDIECRTCEVHRLPLDLFCLLDECCVCQECDVQGHKEHTTASVGDTRRQFEMDLQEKQAEVVKTISAAEKAICKLQSNNVAIETSVAGILTVVEQQFAMLQTAVEEARRGVVEELERERRRALRQAEGIQAHLEQKRAELKKTAARMEKLARNKTDVDFLEKYSHWRKGMVDVCLPGWYISLTDHQASFCSVVAEATQELCDHIRSCYMEKLKICKNGIKTIINAQTTESQPSSLPHPDTWEDFLKYKSHLTIDPDTAHHFLRLTEDNRKVTNTSPWQHSYPDNPARFEYWRQAMTSESLYLGRRYIEVELVGEGAHVGVTYKSIDRKLEQSSSCITGNDFSWCLGRNRRGFSAWHAGVETPLEVTGIARVGLYIDFEAGSVAFYNVTGTMTLLHEYKAHFMEPLYATVWLSKKDNMVFLISTTT